MPNVQQASAYRGLELEREVIEVGMIARNAADLAAFYGDVLGLPMHYSQSGPKGRTWYFWCGSSRIKMSQHDTPPPHPNPLGGMRGGYGLRWLTIRTSDVEEMVERCRSLGCDVPIGVSHLDDGTTYAVVADPEGNWVEFRHGDGLGFR